MIGVTQNTTTAEKTDAAARSLCLKKEPRPPARVLSFTARIVDRKARLLVAQEPPDASDPILKLDNVVLAPHALCWTDQLFAGNGAADVKAVLEVQHGRTPYLVVNRAVLDTERWRRRMADFGIRFERYVRASRSVS